jgi:hypothetical protein
MGYIYCICFYENVSVNISTISENDSIIFHQVWLVNITLCKLSAYAIDCPPSGNDSFAGSALASALISYPVFL